MKVNKAGMSSSFNIPKGLANCALHSQGRLRF